MGDVILDLFGMPVRERRQGRGRPEHVWSQENSNKINLLFAMGYDVKDAAAALGITQPTLRKHYFSEVEGRRAAELRLLGLQLSRLNDEAAKGNVAAIKELNALRERGLLMRLSEKVTRRGKAEPKAPAKGKKELALEAAQQVTGRFGVRPAPPRLIN